MTNDPLQNELRRLVSRLPDVPVSSNFTARVMQEVERQEATHSRNWKFLAWNWHALLPRVAVAGVLGIAGFALYHHEVYNERVELAQNVALIAQAQPLPKVEALENFDAIQRMSQPVHADKELIALLQ
ncbi:MAG TPA: hypothetical protein VFY06_01000 [Verrucomicrobiae bacterium]|nr:hypothetical protein [Verrucomicrobiae bacterium]